MSREVSHAEAPYELHGRGRPRRRRSDRQLVWPECSVCTALGRALGYDGAREHERLYRATLMALESGMLIGRGRHGVVVSLTNEPSDPKFRLAVKVIPKVFTSSRGRAPSFHRAVSHTLHLQNEIAAMAKLSRESTFIVPLYCAMQDDECAPIVYLYVAYVCVHANACAYTYASSASIAACILLPALHQPTS